MKRISIILSAFVLLAAMSASASEIRTLTMGRANTIVKDPGNIWEFPSTINMYGDQAEASFSDNYNSNSEFWRFGVHYTFNANNPFVLGVYVREENAFNPYQYFSYNRPFDDFFDATSSTQGGSGSLYKNQMFDVFYGRTMNGNPFAAHVSIYNSSLHYENAGTTPAQNDKEGLTAFGVVLGLTTGGGTADWAVGARVTSFTDEDDGVAEFEKDAGIELWGEGRRWWTQNSKIAWVGHGMVGYSKFGVKDPVNPADASGYTSVERVKYFGVNVGLGLNYTPSSKVLATLDFGLNYMKWDWTYDESTTAPAASLAYAEKDTDFSLPPYYRIGLDGEVLSWLDVRFGATNDRSHYVSEWSETYSASPTSNYAYKYTYNQSPSETFFGLGFHWGDLELDTYVDPSFLVNGPYFVSGDDTNNMFWETVATYYFGK